MSFNTPGFYLLLTTIGVLSPFLITLLPKGKINIPSLFIAAIAVCIAALLPLYVLGSAGLVWQFMFLQFLLYFSFVAVSRMRQRKSAFLHGLMSIFSNGQWFVAMWILSEIYLVSDYAKDVLGEMTFSNEFLVLLVAAIASTLAGRMVGVQWMQWVEAKWEVRTESVGSEKLRFLDSHTPRVLSYSVIACLAGYGIFFPSFFLDACIVTALGLSQSGVYAITTRFANRNHPGWTMVIGLVGGIIFYIHWIYLISFTLVGGIMPLVLLVPYIIATITGSNLGAKLSMFLEVSLKLKADEHVLGRDEYKNITWHRKILWAMTIGGILYIVGNEYILEMLGQTVHMIQIPLPLTMWFGNEYARYAALAIGGLMFFLNSSTHTLSSRAGNRNHAPFHAVTCVLHGIVAFSVGTFIILNARFIDLLPIAIFSAAAGQLFAQKLSIRLEKILQSVMDPPKSEETA